MRLWGWLSVWEIAEWSLLRGWMSRVLLASGGKARSNHVLHTFHSRWILVIRHFLIHAWRLDTMRHSRCSDIRTSLRWVTWINLGVSLRAHHERLFLIKSWGHHSIMVTCLNNGTCLAKWIYTSRQVIITPAAFNWIYKKSILTCAHHNFISALLVLSHAEIVTVGGFLTLNGLLCLRVL